MTERGPRAHFVRSPSPLRHPHVVAWPSQAITSDMTEGGPRAHFVRSPSPLRLPHVVAWQSPAITSDLKQAGRVAGIRPAQPEARTGV